MDHDINKRQTRLIKKFIIGNSLAMTTINYLFLARKFSSSWIDEKRFWQSFPEQLITVSSLYKTAHEILYSQVWKSTHTSKTLYLSSRSPYQKEDFLENEAFDCLTKFLKTSVFNKKMLIHLSWKGVTKIHTWILTRSDTFTRRQASCDTCKDIRQSISWVVS